ncbi:MAG: AAA family ATPase [Candidatus Zixiibacteriota bacterium]
MNDAREFVPLEDFDRQHPRGRAPNPGYLPPHLPGRLDLGLLQGKPIPERRWLVDQWIPLGTVTMLGGDGGTGKSILALQILTAAASGKSWLDLPTMRCKGVGIFCEDSGDELHRRMANVLAHYGADFSDCEDLTLHSLVGEENALLDFDREAWKWNESERYFQIGRAIEDSGAQLIVLDSLHDFFSGNENSRFETRRFVQMIAAWARDHDAAVILNAHPSLTGLNSGTGTSGSTAWSNSVRSRLYLSRQVQTEGEELDNDIRELKRLKANYAGTGDCLKLKWSNGVFVPVVEPTGILAVAEKARARDVFVELLAKREIEGRPVSPSKHASNYAPKAFASDTRRQGFTKHDFERAMEELFTAGTVKSVPYGRPGDTRQKIVRAGVG